MVSAPRLQAADRERRSPQAHAAIIAAAVAEAAARGYFAATIEAIARRAGTGKQTVYRWWGGKAGLYLEVYAILVPAEALAADTGSARGDIEALLTRIFKLFETTPAAAILAGLISEAQAEPAVAEALRRQLAGGRRSLLTEPLRRGMARGDVPAEFDPEMTADLLTAAIWHRLLLATGPADAPFARRLARTLVPEQAPCRTTALPRRA